MAQVLDEGRQVIGVSVEVIRRHAGGVVALAVSAMVETDAGVCPGLRFDVTGGAPEVGIGARAYMQHEGRTRALDLVLKANPVRRRKGRHLARVYAVSAPRLPIHETVELACRNLVDELHLKRRARWEIAQGGGEFLQEIVLLIDWHSPQRHVAGRRL